MREIKFRAWYKPNGEMVMPEKLESINFDVKTLGVYMPLENKGFHKLRTSDFELMQFTGLKDKSGKEIYEGDIVRYLDAYNNSSESGEDWEEVVSTGEIKWDNDQAGFGVTNRYSIDLESFFENIDESEVIGNIYEHPHLLMEAL